MLVTFEVGYTSAWEFFNMQDELSEIIGREVDLNTAGFLSDTFRDEVIAEAMLIYESHP